MLDTLRLKLIQHRDKIKSSVEIAACFAQYALTKSKFSLIGGGILAVEKLLTLGTNNPHIYFCAANGWIPLCTNQQISVMFTSILDKLDGHRLPFEYDNAKLFETEIGSFASVYGRYDGADGISLYAKLADQRKVLDFLVNEKLKELNSKYIALTHKTIDEHGGLCIFPLKFNSIESSKSKEIIASLHRSFDNNLNRSLILYGLPGTGKSTLGQTIVDHFKFRTLKVHPGKNIPLPLILEFIDIFNIEAIMLDDFDQVVMDEKLLEFLEVINSKVKLVIGVANILDGFNPAILRPGRFDEIIKIDSIEEPSIKIMLGDLSETYFERVKYWPIAYIKELKKQSIINFDILETKFKDLEGRVEKLKKSYENNEISIPCRKEN